MVHGEVRRRKKNIETTKKVIITDAMKFQQLYEEIKNYQDGKIYYDYITSEIWESFEKDEIIEVVVNLELPKLISLANAANTLKNMANIAEEMTGQTYIKGKDLKKN